MLTCWLHNQGAEIKITQRLPDASSNPNPKITLGDLQFSGTRMGVGTDPTEGSAVSWTNQANNIEGSHSLGGDGLVSKSDTAQRIKNTFAIDRDSGAALGAFIQDRFKVLEDFRVSANLGSRSGVLESMTGGDTASVLLNLKNRSPGTPGTG